MKAIFYKDLLQVRRNTGLLIMLIVTGIMTVLFIVLATVIQPGRTFATVLLQITLILFLMSFVPTCAMELVRGDIGNGTLTAFTASGRPKRQYLIAQVIVALIPSGALGALIVLAFRLLVPSLRTVITGANGLLLLSEPLLAAFVLFLWSIFFKGKALIMTATTTKPITDSINGQSKPVAGTPIAVSVRDMTFGYKRRKPVLSHISLDVPAGQSIGILGYNGVGKTTLFGVILGLLRPQHGDAVINADVFPSMRDVFQLTDSNNLTADMTVRENIRFRAMLYATHENPHPVDVAHLDELPMVRAFELGEHLDKKVRELSSGLKKRAGIVTGMLFEPKLIMLDEPTNAVDPLTRQLLIELMKQLRADGRTIMTITHDLDYCWEVTDRVVILDNRHLVRDCMTHDFADYQTFMEAATLGRETTDVDFGLHTK
ncbi:ATP-binding cassette domain-containing protein [Bifidobacterium vansinderenii]|uniref:ATP-binding protein of ABC transporter system n=1 Tax=Bifidobacterium vansinderenii TaxID=1984871 RepID=A0A229VXZ9_9BIFI|nr:ABC transporter ATP-binding protein [Bifidobacterium vansinderenii]OXN00499.1 ATP-binding protein of ABC transporter system [Bifidobacterium vansinderenii]